MKSRLLIFALIASVLTACAPAANSSTSQNGIQIEQARIVVRGPATQMAGMGGPTAMAGMNMDSSSLAGYMIIKNAGSTDDQLLTAAADFAGMVMLHKSVIGSNGVATMQQLPSIDIPAGQTVALQPGGFHIMFMDLKTVPQVGSQIALTFVFRNAGTISAQADVVGE
jgi:copper(I)-binding protein